MLFGLGQQLMKYFMGVCRIHELVKINLTLGNTRVKAPVALVFSAPVKFVYRVSSIVDR